MFLLKKKHRRRLLQLCVMYLSTGVKTVSRVEKDKLPSIEDRGEMR